MQIYFLYLLETGKLDGKEGQLLQWNLAKITDEGKKHQRIGEEKGCGVDWNDKHWFRRQEMEVTANGYISMYGVMNMY